jgi:hypothetical protein
MASSAVGSPSRRTGSCSSGTASWRAPRTSACWRWSAATGRGAPTAGTSSRRPTTGPPASGTPMARESRSRSAHPACRSTAPRGAPTAGGGSDSEVGAQGDAGSPTDPAACVAGEWKTPAGLCLPAGLPADTACAPGELALEDGRCQPAGVPPQATIDLGDLERLPRAGLREALALDLLLAFFLMLRRAGQGAAGEPLAFLRSRAKIYGRDVRGARGRAGAGALRAGAQERAEHRVDRRDFRRWSRGSR